MTKKIIGIIVALAVIGIIVWVVVRGPERPAPEEIVDEVTVLQAPAVESAVVEDTAAPEVIPVDSVEDVR